MRKIEELYASIFFLIWVWWLKTDGSVVAVVDVIHVTHAAVATVNQVHHLSWTVFTHY